MKKTIENLTKAFIGESQARNRYTFYAKAAKKEGFEQISEIFLLTADNEREHAKWLFRMIQELKAETDEKLEDLTVEAEAPLILGTTDENLIAAIGGEHFEYSEMYPEFAKTAEEEGYPKIAERLMAIAKAEEHHEARYMQLLKLVETDTVFQKTKDISWICRKCGYVHEGKTPPEECPACDHPTAYYQVLCDDY
ncbi:rubrerythrin [Methanobacterium alcaliphilum]|uniref:rubrerythrin n=1 Tax=Methanobacterium alcaliphilum TaxID=392018 RepID=UPI00200B4EEB|nr:rubrerythrin family protein [Methanobacterium alcaliphilum]MCK9150812.1 rubrerythrin family protein [Methanobacterium alcaliphilum]